MIRTAVAAILLCLVTAGTAEAFAVNPGAPLDPSQVQDMRDWDRAAGTGSVRIFERTWSELGRGPTDIELGS